MREARDEKTLAQKEGNAPGDWDGRARAQPRVAHRRGFGRPWTTLPRSPSEKERYPLAHPLAFPFGARMGGRPASSSLDLRLDNAARGQGVRASSASRAWLARARGQSRPLAPPTGRGCRLTRRASAGLLAAKSQ